MKLSELIKHLKECKKQYGNADVITGYADFETKNIVEMDIKVITGPGDNRNSVMIGDERYKKLLYDNSEEMIKIRGFKV